MSFKEIKAEIEYGDTVLLYVGFDNMLPIVVSKGQTHQTKFGAVKHNTLVGRKYGTRMQCPKGWIYVVHPTPELWTQCLPHRTQILYSTDISMVIFQLDLKPGSVVVEAGTGSGSLSHSILRTIQPSGHLHTFEFHKERCSKAEEEFRLHGLSSFVTVTHQDVCEDGFPCEHIADAVFLDLPRPWDCILTAKKSLKKEGGRICSFSPCIEQVQRSCEKLSEEGFQDITTIECLNRSYNIQYAKLPNVNFTNEKDSSTQDSLCSNEDGKESTSTENQAHSTKLPKLADEQTPRNSRSKDVSTEKKSGETETNSLCFSSAVPVTTMPGHTGFLTFATLLCQIASD